ncbi:MAG: hypothetical protein EOO90_03520 [Pedobacter sp.]|nr:MAG: hypothetical protein EOO90_03520 [Pedobacter sp.]
MIKSGIEVEQITSKFALLRLFIQQSAKIGRLNIHKDCEGLIMRMLNLAYGYKLVNLNEDKNSFPAVDLGELGKIAFQVTSEKTSDKVNQTLNQVLNHSLFSLYPSINIFIVGTKQTSYSINTNTLPSFEFSYKKNILDFDDLLKKIAHSEPEAISSILLLLEQELPNIFE